ncbi:MAG: hypothetical protein DELT_00254 [Desulfovibrio sp.]
MSAERIKNAALLRFAAQGYDATSLAEIAGDVGIKTPSIYAHFSSKQDLFRQLVGYASGLELAEIRACLHRPDPVRSVLREYFYGTAARFGSAPHLRFWLRSLYLPPQALVAEITVHDREFAAALEAIVLAALRHPERGVLRPSLPHETVAAAFIGMLRGVHAELLYCGGEGSAKALGAMWMVFEKSLDEIG